MYFSLCDLPLFFGFFKTWFASFSKKCLKTYKPFISLSQQPLTSCIFSLKTGTMWDFPGLTNMPTGIGVIPMWSCSGNHTNKKEWMHFRIESENKDLWLLQYFCSLRWSHCVAQVQFYIPNHWIQGGRGKWLSSETRIQGK